MRGIKIKEERWVHDTCPGLASHTCNVYARESSLFFGRSRNPGTSLAMYVLKAADQWRKRRGRDGRDVARVPPRKYAENSRDKRIFASDNYNFGVLAFGWVSLSTHRYWFRRRSNYPDFEFYI